MVHVDQVISYERSGITTGTPLNGYMLNLLMYVANEVMGMKYEPPKERGIANKYRNMVSHFFPTLSFISDRGSMF